VTDSETKYAIRMIVISSSLAGMAFLSFNNGLLLAYFSHLEIPSATILILLAILPVTHFFFIIPFSYFSDLLGKKFIGTIGIIFTVFGFFLLSTISFFPENYLTWTVGLGIAIFGAGSAMNIAPWFALIHPIIPEKIRGRFFGRLRLTWQSVSVLLTLVAISILEHYHTLRMYQAVMGFITILLAVRLIFYQRIPELEKKVSKKKTFRESFLKVLAIPEYLPFCAYCFLLTLFTGACPLIFNLIEKDVLQLTKVDIVFIGNLLIVGALAGFYLGGRMVDKFGTKYVFFLCHFGFGAIVFLFIWRDIFPGEIIIFVGILTVLFGMVQAASGIAMTSETLVIIPAGNKSLATGLWFTLYSGGIGLSGVLSGQILDLELLRDSWTWFGHHMSRYDSLLLFCGTMVLLMTVTLGLIPSVIRKTPAAWIPQSS